MIDPASIPKPQNWGDYAACYKANLDEAKAKLEWARARFRQFRDAGQIVERVEGGFKCEGPTAAGVLGDFVRWKSDVDHWHARYQEARSLAGIGEEQTWVA